MDLNLTGKTALVTGSTKSEGSEKSILDLAQERGLSNKDLDREFFEKIKPTFLLKRFANIDEIATFVAYLVSPLVVVNNGVPCGLMAILYPQYSDIILN